MRSSAPQGMPRFRTVRIVALLGVLLVVGLTSAHQRVYTRGWNLTLEARVYPINGDGHIATARYIDGLQDRDFAIIDRWAEREAKRHGLDLATPFRVRLGERVDALPPTFPGDATPIDVLLWGLRMRFWAWRNTPDDDGINRVRLFVVYHEGDDGQSLAHSLGLQKGLIGLVHAYALPQQTQQNNIVIAHELLHTVGALDKYDGAGGPVFPHGYANPDRTPVHPQRSAEIMAGRIPVAWGRSYMAESLRSVVLNEWTAKEINWLH